MKTFGFRAKLVKHDLSNKYVKAPLDVLVTSWEVATDGSIIASAIIILDSNGDKSGGACSS